MSDFVHLHLHTQYSLLDGANKLPDVLERAHELGQRAIAMTDHGNLHGAVEFYLEAKRIGIKPILGCELYVSPVSRFERKTREQGGEGARHLTVMARDREGYRNLCRLSTLAYREGFYFKPRVDHELLEKYSEGLIILSGCLASELGSAAMANDLDRARKVVEFYANAFKDRYYLELQPHPIPEQQKLNDLVCKLADEFGLPVVGTTDCHYLSKDDHFAQEVLMCVSTGKQITDPDRLKHDGITLHLKTDHEMRAELSHIAKVEEALRSTVRISEECDVVFDFKTHYFPHFHSDEDRPLIEVMADLAREGLAKRMPVLESQVDFHPGLKQVYHERLEEEIKLIGQMGFAGYFLVVSDFIVWAKENEIPVGPGRGSAAGSLVAYALRITELDPITHKCLFERFLNPERVSLPDIDVDFCINGRDKVIKYVVAKYGKDQVAQIATFGTLKAKAAIKDVGRALGLSYAETDRVAQLVPAPRQGFDYPLAEAIKMEPKLAEYAESDAGRDMIQLALKLEGLTRHTSTHAAGVVIGDRPLVDLLPLMVDKDGNDVTQYSMSYVEKVGLVKFDFLGLKTLTVLHTATSIIRGSRGLEIDLNLLPLNDAKTYDILCAGNTTGVFQLESTGITDMVVRLKPSGFDDLVAILALYRPGPLDAGMVDHYIERKHGREKIVYLHPLMENSLSDTYGVIVYQEQIMQLARELAGYSLGEADLLRRAMGKKNPEEMAAQRDRFVSGAVKQSIPTKLADEIFQQMETFARYGFNRSHSAAYALISFQTAYLKAHYGVEFMAALMSHEMEDSDKTFKNFNECRKQGIKVLPPDINESGAGFTVKDGCIRFGLAAVKGTGEKAVETIIAARETGPFQGFEDIFTRIDLKAINKRVMENLTKSGAFDFCRVSRREMLEKLDDMLRAFQVRPEDLRQLSLFGAGGAPKPPAVKILGLPEWPVNQRLNYEREALGFFISGHPLEKFRTDLRRFGASTTAEVKSGGKREVRVAGIVSALKLKNTKKGDRYASFVLEDWLGTIEALVWPDTYRLLSNQLASEDPVLVSGRADISEERSTLIVEKMESLISLRDRSATQGFLMIGQADNIDVFLPRFQQLFSKYPGTCPVKVKIYLESGEVSMMLRDDKNAPICVQPCEGLSDEAEQIAGRPVLSFV